MHTVCWYTADQKRYVWGKSHRGRKWCKWRRKQHSAFCDLAYTPLLLVILLIHHSSKLTASSSQKLALSSLWHWDWQCHPILWCHLLFTTTKKKWLFMEIKHLQPHLKMKHQESQAKPFWPFNKTYCYLFVPKCTWIGCCKIWGYSLARSWNGRD